MKILCFGDVHLGASPDLGRVPFGEGSRLDDQRKVLGRIARLAEEEQCDIALFAGDAYHRRRPTPSEIIAWRQFVEDLNRRGVDLIAIDGNHDVESADRPSALELVRTFRSYEVSRVPTLVYPSPQIAVATLPWTPPAHLVASLNGGVPRDEVNARVAELLIDTARELREQIPDGKCSVLLAHWSVSGSSLPNGLPVDLLREPVLPLPDLDAMGWDFVVLGHIHNPGFLNGGQIEPDRYRGAIFYTGSPALVDWGEASVDHCVWILDTETWDVRSFPIEDRRFLTIDVDLAQNAGMYVTAELDATDRIAAALMEAHPLQDAVVRVRYRCTSEQARRVDVAALRGFCAEAGVHKLFAIQPQIERADRARVEGVDESLSEMEALDRWIESQSLAWPRGQSPIPPLRDLTARYLEELAA